MLCKADEVNFLGGPGRGVILIKLQKQDDRLLGFIASDGDRDLMTVETTRGAEQTISTAKYEVTGRGGKGRELLQRGQFTRVVPRPVEAPATENGGWGAERPIAIDCRDAVIRATVAELDDRLSEPTDATVEVLGRLSGDIVVLGVGGKMGPTLARMARRASELGRRRPARDRRVAIFVARILPHQLQSWGIETIEADLLSPDSLRRLPDAPNVVYMAGMKFGTTGQESLTWAMNAYLPALVCNRYRASRIVAFSTGNVYRLSPVSGGGSNETDPLHPVGEYAMSCVGRERIFEHFSRTFGTPMALLRLNYAVEMRYGVLRRHRPAGVRWSPGIAEDGHI